MDLEERAGKIPLVPGDTPMVVDRAEGAYLYTHDGRKLLDAAGGAIVGNIGYGRPEVADVAAETMRKTSYVVPGTATEERMRLVERLVERWLPEGMTRCNFTTGGSESVDSAIRLARMHHLAAGRPERWKVIGRQISYHGVTLAALAVGGHEVRRAGYEPLLLDFPKAPPHYPLRCPIDHEHTSPDACGMAAADALEEVIERAGPETVAAFIAEPVVGAAGAVLVPPQRYWERVVEICRRYDVLVIADEVMCGFGRTGAKFAIDHFGVTPDIMTGGKGLAGGYMPIGGVYCTDEVVAPMASSGHRLMFFTFGSHPVSCAVADKVLEIMEDERLVQRSADMGAKLNERLEVLEKHPHVAQVRGKGLFCGIELVRDRDTLEPFGTDVRIHFAVMTEGAKRGVRLYPAGGGPVAESILLGPPFIITDDEVETIAGVLEESIDAAVASLG